MSMALGDLKKRVKNKASSMLFSTASPDQEQAHALTPFGHLSKAASILRGQGLFEPEIFHELRMELNRMEQCQSTETPEPAPKEPPRLSAQAADLLEPFIGSLLYKAQGPRRVFKRARHLKNKLF